MQQTVQAIYEAGMPKDSAKAVLRRALPKPPANVISGDQRLLAIATTENPNTHP